MDGHRFVLSLTLPQYMYDLLEAVIIRQTAPEEAYRKLDEMNMKLMDTLRKTTKTVPYHAYYLLILSPMLETF